jgi:cytochrome P450
MRLTLSIICKTLFSLELEDRVKEISDAITVGQHHITYQYRHLAAPAFIPTRRNRRFKASHTRLDALILGIIRSRRAETNRPQDLLTLLLKARYEEGGGEEGDGMDNRQIRDELITLFLAGHETTANALAWTWYLLSQHPEVEARLQTELKKTLGGRAPSADDLPSLPYAEQVFAEAMRLYPPAWILHTRTALSDDQLPTGTFVPSGMDLLISPYLVHHDPRFFPDPDRFDPERFSPAARQNLPPFAYFPFGGGSRMCIGESFAKMEGILLLAAIAQRFKMALVPGQTIEPEPLVTLRPRNGVRMQLTRRE